MSTKKTRSSTKKSIIKYEEDLESLDLPLSVLKNQEESDTVVVCTIIEEDGDMNYLTEMAVRDELEPSTIICKFCPKTFKSSYEMRKHQRNCLLNVEKSDIVIPAKIAQLAKVNKPNYSCKFCKKKYKFLHSYKDHLINEHSTLENSIKCNLCIARCPDRAAFKLHTEKVHNAPVFKCPNCPAKFSRGYHVTRHMDQKGCNGQKSVKNFSCKICGALFSRKDNLMYHLRNNHISSTKKFQCKKCVFGVSNFNTLIRHYKKLHMDKVFICDICDAQLRSRMAIGKHLEIHGEKNFSCGICSYMSHTIEVMKRHVMVHTKEKPLKCHDCGASFIQMIQLKAHMLKHTRTCEICDAKDFKSNLALRIHMRRHMGKGKLVCPKTECIMSKREFADDESLDEHLKTHTDNQTIYKCKICNKSYQKELFLRRHLRLHSLERTRQCMYCEGERTFSRGDRLLRHMRLKHPEAFAKHVAKVKGIPCTISILESKLNKAETDHILSELDSLQDWALTDNGSESQFIVPTNSNDIESTPYKLIKTQPSTSPVMTEQELGDSALALLTQLIDAPTLSALGATHDDVDLVLQRVIIHCGAEAAQGSEWSRVQRVRENLKLLFVRVLDDDDVRRMLDRHTVDQVVRHMLAVHKEEDTS